MRRPFRRTPRSSGPGGATRRAHLRLVRVPLAAAILAGVLCAFASAAAFRSAGGSPSADGRLSARHASHPRKERHRPARHAALAVRVEGNRLVNALGHTLRLVGVNRSGTQYMCALGRGIFDGPADAASIAAIRTWRVNTVRVPLNEDCWLGINPVNPAYSGVAYRAAIESYVTRLNAAGIYAILDVHWNAPGDQPASGPQDMLDASHGYALWRSIATAFKTDPAVLFDLYNEPHTLGAGASEQWSCWARGCGEYAGMSGLVTTVRAVGAHNVILLGGVGWAADDSQWLGHEPRDPLHQLAASFHVYDEHTLCTTVQCWNRTLLPIAAKVPVVADEFGEMQCGAPAAIAWLNSWMSYASIHGFSMLAWSWNAKQAECSREGPLLITSYAGSPTPYGAAVQAFYDAHGAQ